MSVSCANAVQDDVIARLRRVLRVHFDPCGGSSYWLDRQRELGFDVVEEIREPADLRRLGVMQPSDLADRPLLDFVPRRLHATRHEWVVAQTGGTTGKPVWTAYRWDEFADAFVRPFEVAAEHVGFPHGENWLYVGPSGPHVIGRAAAQLARCLGSPEPFTVDFDPRWAKKLPDGSFAQRRYLEHVIEQALDVMASQHVGVLFTTPKVLGQLARRMSPEHRKRIRGVHYGGMALGADELAEFQQRWFPKAVHLSGYGNTLFGCCLELNVSPGRPLDYFPFGSRLLLGVLDGDVGVDAARIAAPGHRGRLAFTRLDETVLLVNVVERDEAESLAPPSTAPVGFSLPGVRNPAPLATSTPQASVGLY